MIKLTNSVVASTSQELEILKSLLVSSPESFNYSIIANDDLDFPYKLLVETTDVPIISMDEFLAFLALKINEVNQSV